MKRENRDYALFQGQFCRGSTDMEVELGDKHEAALVRVHCPALRELFVAVNLSLPCNMSSSSCIITSDRQIVTNQQRWSNIHYHGQKHLSPTNILCYACIPFFFSRYFSEPKEEPTGSIIAASRKKNLIDNGIVQ